MGLSKMSAVIAGSSQLLSRYVVGFGLVIFLSACAKVDFDQVKGEELKKEIAKMNITFPVFAIEPSKLLDVEIPRVLPTTYVFDREGKLKATLVGPQTEDSLLALVD
jgi:hypothetical protein